MRVDNEEQSYRSTRYYKSNIVILDDEDGPVPSCVLTQRICHGIRDNYTSPPFAKAASIFSTLIRGPIGRTSDIL